MKGFFPESILLQSKSPVSLIPACGKCGLYKTCQSPKMDPTGEGRRKILIVAEAPGKQEDAEGIQLCGRSGQFLEQVLRELGIKMRKDCWLTNSLICRPPNNATPKDKQLGYCQPNLINTIKRLNPEIIIPLGAPAVKQLMRWCWKAEKIEGIGRWVGWQIPHQGLNTWICPAWHPSYVMRETQKSRLCRRIFKDHLKQAISKEARPWDKLPDYESQIEKIHSSSKAAKIIRKFNRKGGLIAFDYETNMLKPDDDRARIISCSVCWRGKRTIAFLWHGEAIDAMRDLLLGSSTKKIASNLQFENRWTIKEFGESVVNWDWDTMLGAHWLDSRKKICGLKFQSLIHLGYESYDDHIKPLLGTNGDDMVNQAMKEIDVDSLLLYNGLDSLLEYYIAALQKRTGNYGEVTSRNSK